MHLRWRISKYFNLVHVSHVSFCQHHLPWFCWQKCIWNGFRQIMTKVSSNSSSTILSAVVCLKSDNENWSSPHKCYIFHIFGRFCTIVIIIMYLFIYLTLKKPLIYWMKSQYYWYASIVWLHRKKQQFICKQMGIDAQSKKCLSTLWRQWEITVL